MSYYCLLTVVEVPFFLNVPNMPCSCDCRLQDIIEVHVLLWWFECHPLLVLSGWHLGMV